MRIMRANLDGSHIETLVETGRGDPDCNNETKCCVGVAVDIGRQHIYWSQPGADDGSCGRILRAGIDIPAGQTAADRTDITTLVDSLCNPADLALDATNRMLYWTDRGPIFHGSTVHRTSIDDNVRHSRVIGNLTDGVSISLDVQGNRIYVAEQGGSIYSARLDGSDKHVVTIGQGSLIAIAWAEVQLRHLSCGAPRML